MTDINDHQSEPYLSLPQMKAVNNALSKEVFKGVSCFLSLCVNVLGVAGLGSRKILEVFLSDLPEMMCWYHHLIHLFWRNQPKQLCVGLTQDVFLSGRGGWWLQSSLPFHITEHFCF